MIKIKLKKPTKTTSVVLDIVETIENIPLLKIGVETLEEYIVINKETYSNIYIGLNEKGFCWKYDKDNLISEQDIILEADSGFQDWICYEIKTTKDRLKEIPDEVGMGILQDLLISQIRIMMSLTNNKKFILLDSHNVLTQFTEMVINKIKEKGATYENAISTTDELP